MPAVAIEPATLAGRFYDLIICAREGAGHRVVALVDEYDKPLLDAMVDDALVGRNRGVLRGLCGVLKKADARLESVRDRRHPPLEGRRLLRHEQPDRDPPLGRVRGTGTPTFLVRTIRDAGLDVRSMDEDAVYAAGSHLMDYRAEGRVSRGQPVGGGPQEADSTCRGR